MMACLKIGSAASPEESDNGKQATVSRLAMTQTDCGVSVSMEGVWREAGDVQEIVSTYSSEPSFPWPAMAPVGTVRASRTGRK